MNSFLVVLLLGSIGLAAATYMPTKDPNEWMRRMQEPALPTAPSWFRAGGLPTKYPHGYSFTDAELRLAAKQNHDEIERVRIAYEAAQRKAATDKVDVEKRRNLLVGRYGFRIGKRGNEDELTEADYQELIDEDRANKNPFGNFIQ